MTNSLYTGYKQVVTGDTSVTGFSIPNLETGDQRLILCDGAEYTSDIILDRSLADVPVVSRVQELSIAGASIVPAGITGRILYSCTSPVTFPTVSGDQSEMLVLYNHTGVESSSLLIILFDQFISGMPVTPNGGDVQIFFNNGIWTW